MPVNPRPARSAEHPNYTHQRADPADAGAVNHAFATFKPQRVVNLAAQAGVRYSLQNPQAYVASNLVGFVNILEGCRQHEVGTWSTPRPARSTAPTASCRSRWRARSTTRSACTPPARKRTS